MSKKIDFANNIKRIREERGMTKSDFAKLIEVSDVTIGYWERGDRTPKTGTIEVLARKLMVSTDELIFSRVENKPKSYLRTNISLIKDKESNSMPHPINESLTVFGKVCAGDGITAFEDPIDQITNPFHRINGEKFALQVDGDSMNKVVPDKAYAIIKKQPIVENGQIAVVLINGETSMLKRFYQVDKETIMLKPESYNDRHKPLTFIGEEVNSLNILGKYIGCVMPEWI